MVLKLAVFFTRRGATAYENSPAGGELVAGSMRLWGSNAGDGYIHTGKRRLQKAGVTIGREAGNECEERPRPISSYTGARERRKTQETSG